MSSGRRGTSSAEAATECPRLLISALASGVGKTSISAGLLAALRQDATQVSAFKCGPDYLDPQILRAAGSLREVRNLDLWLTSPSLMRTSFRTYAARGPKALTLVEGAMGLFDTSVWGTSNADVSRSLSLPVVLVVDASRSVESVAASVRGAKALLPPGRLVGVLVNQAGRGWHAETTRKAIEVRARVPVLGTLPFAPEVRIPERHLGLRTPTTDPDAGLSARVGELSGWVKENVDLEAVREAAETAPSLPAARKAVQSSSSSGRTVAVASDPAFCFTYPENLEVFRARGDLVQTFSPMSGEGLPPSTDVVYLPGGYPELHAESLSRAEPLRKELKGWVQDGRPLFAECGGMMFLLDELVDAEGRRHAMSGAFPGSSKIGPRLAAFGYVEAVVREPSPFGDPGVQVRGHVFHHSVRTAPETTRWAWELHPRRGGTSSPDGYLRGRALAGYLHARLDANPRWVSALAPS